MVESAKLSCKKRQHVPDKKIAHRARLRGERCIGLTITGISIAGFMRILQNRHLSHWPMLEFEYDSATDIPRPPEDIV